MDDTLPVYFSLIRETETHTGTNPSERREWTTGVVKNSFLDIKHVNLKLRVNIWYQRLQGTPGSSSVSSYGETASHLQANVIYSLFQIIISKDFSYTNVAVRHWTSCHSTSVKLTLLDFSFHQSFHFIWLFLTQTGNRQVFFFHSICWLHNAITVLFSLISLEVLIQSGVCLFPL